MHRLFIAVFLAVFSVAYYLDVGNAEVTSEAELNSVKDLSFIKIILFCEPYPECEIKDKKKVEGSDA